MKRSACRPASEQLESRELLTVFQVTSAENAGPGTLRAAINASNQSPGADVIQFQAFQGPGTRTLSISAALPAITGPVIIDGYTAGGGVRNTSTNPAVNNATPGIEIRSTAGDAILTINPRGGGSQVRGIAFTVKGGAAPALLVNQASSVTIDGNAFRAEPPTHMPSAIRIVGGSRNTIGGDISAYPALQNVMTNYETGVELVGPSRFNAVVGNRIGGEAPQSRVRLQANGVWLRPAASNNTVVQNYLYKNWTAIRDESSGNVTDGNTIVPA